MGNRTTDGDVPLSVGDNGRVIYTLLDGGDQGDCHHPTQLPLHILGSAIHVLENGETERMARARSVDAWINTHAPWLSAVTTTESELDYLTDETPHVIPVADTVKRLAFGLYPALRDLAAFSQNPFNDYFYGYAPICLQEAMKSESSRDFTRRTVGTTRKDVVKRISAETYAERIDWLSMFSGMVTADAMIEFLDSQAHPSTDLCLHTSEEIECWKQGLRLIGESNCRRILLNGAKVSQLDMMTLVSSKGLQALSTLKIRNGRELAIAIDTKVPQEEKVGDVQYPQTDVTELLSQYGEVVSSYGRAQSIGAEYEWCCGNSTFFRKCSSGETVLLLIESQFLMEVTRNGDGEYHVIQFRGPDNSSARSQYEVQSRIEQTLEAHNSKAPRMKELHA